MRLSSNLTIVESQASQVRSENEKINEQVAKLE